MTLRIFFAATALSAILITGCKPQTNNPANTVETKAELPVVETFATFDFRPGNMGISKSGKMIMSLQPLDNPETKLVQLMKDGSYKPYPNDAFAKGPNSELRAPIGVKIDDAGVAWVLDIGSRKLFSIDTKTDTVKTRFAIPSQTLKNTSFLQDFALDQKRNRVIIADMTQGDLKSAPEPAFVVIDLDTGATRRVAESHPSMMPEMEGGFALNPITIDSKYEYVYYGALHGRTMYRVPAAAFDGDSSAVTGAIQKFGDKSYSDGSSIDTAGNVYNADVESHGYGITRPDGDFELIGKLPEGQSWTDGITVGSDGYFYSSSNQLDRSAALSGKNTGTGKYLVVRFKPLAPGTTGR
ncbi:MAG: L-dopachrome tautomerase-related protein [Hellea sp.]